MSKYSGNLQTDKLELAEKIKADLGVVFGGTPTSWPKPFRTKPTFFQFDKKANERYLIQTVARVVPSFQLTDKDREIFYNHIHYGQGVNEDAGGYIWRCWAAMLRLEYQHPLHKDDVVMNELEKTLSPCPVCKSPAAFVVGGFGEKQVRCSKQECNFGLPPDQWTATPETAVFAWESLLKRINTKAAPAEPEVKSQNEKLYRWVVEVRANLRYLTVCATSAKDARKKVHEHMNKNSYPSLIRTKVTLAIRNQPQVFTSGIYLDDEE